MTCANAGRVETSGCDALRRQWPVATLYVGRLSEFACNERVQSTSQPRGYLLLSTVEVTPHYTAKQQSCQGVWIHLALTALELSTRQVIYTRYLAKIRYFSSQQSPICIRRSCKGGVGSRSCRTPGGGSESQFIIVVLGTVPVETGTPLTLRRIRYRRISSVVTSRYCDSIVCNAGTPWGSGGIRKRNSRCSTSASSSIRRSVGAMF